MPRRFLKLRFIRRITLAFGLGISGLLVSLSTINLNFLFGGFLLVFGLILLIDLLVEPSKEPPLFSRVVTENKGLLKLLEKEVKIVVIGGGTGLGTILRGLKRLTSNLTAIVTVADDGGSSGRIRKEFGILPPGDIRSCLIAMADLEPLMEQLMQFRFDGGPGLAGHSFGNLFLTAMTGITGDFQKAIEASCQVLAVRGRVFAATLDNANLRAELKDGSVVKGESMIGKSNSPIKRIYLEPSEAKAVPESLNALEEADLIIIGPGSLFTSVIPPLLVKQVLAAVKASRATKIYICNVMTQPGETDGFTASDHLRALLEHTGEQLVDYMIINDQMVPPEAQAVYAEEGAEPVLLDPEKIISQGVTPITAPLLNTNGLVRHDADLLADLLSALTPSLLKKQIGFPGRFQRIIKKLKELTNIKVGITPDFGKNPFLKQGRRNPIKFNFMAKNINGFTEPAFELYPNKREIFRDLLPQELDLEKNLILGIFLGERPSGGFTLTPISVNLKGTSLFIYYREEEPLGKEVIQRLTYPAVLLTVDKRDLPRGEVLIYFINEDRKKPMTVKKVFL